MPDATSSPPPPGVNPIVAATLAAVGGRLIRGAMDRWSAPEGGISLAGPLVLAAIADGSAFVAQTDAEGRPMAVTSEPGPVVTFATAGTPAAATVKA